jgi:hypothetical protein
MFQVSSRAKRSFLPASFIQHFIVKAINIMAKFQYNPVNKKIFDFAISNFAESGPLSRLAPN